MFERLIPAACLALVSASAHALGWYNDFTIAELQYSRGSDNLLVRWTGGTGNPNPDGCAVSDRFIFPYSSTSPMREKAMILSLHIAFAEGKQIKTMLNGCATGMGGVTYPIMYYIYVP